MKYLKWLMVGILWAWHTMPLQGMIGLCNSTQVIREWMFASNEPSDYGMLAYGANDGTDNIAVFFRQFAHLRNLGLSGDALKVKIDEPLPAGTNTIGKVEFAGSLPAGNNNMGDVDVATIAAGDNAIGRVKITDGIDVAAVATGGNVMVQLGSEIPAGTKNIGDVDIASALPSGTNNIGDVDVASIAAGDNTIGRMKVTDGIDVVSVDVSGNADVAIRSGTTEASVAVCATASRNGISVIRDYPGTQVIVRGSDTQTGTDTVYPISITVPANYIYYIEQVIISARSTATALPIQCDILIGAVPSSVLTIWLGNKTTTTSVYGDKFVWDCDFSGIVKATAGQYIRINCTQGASGLATVEVSATVVYRSINAGS